MKSKTKYEISADKIKEVFYKANLGKVSKITSLDAGEFSSAYFVSADNIEYVIKIAPKSYDNVLTYERDLMEREVSFYKIIQETTNIKTPKIYYYDKSKNIIPSQYFIMERLKSLPLTDCKLNQEQKNKVYENLGTIVAKLHTINGSGFGYEQNGLEDNWYLAISKMVQNLINDCHRYGKKAKSGEMLLRYIDKYEDILKSVESTYTHFDIWDGNIFYDINSGEIALIDTERGFWGDSIGDFVSIEMMKSFNDKVCIPIYNKSAKYPIDFSREQLIRFNIMKAYLGLIVYSEKFARYKKWQIKYISNYFFAKNLFSKAFFELDKIN
ncbi:MAG: aminoglycoside phosphotransferase family protein [Clostridia bacterium]